MGPIHAEQHQRVHAPKRARGPSLRGASAFARAEVDRERIRSVLRPAPSALLQRKSASSMGSAECKQCEKSPLALQTKLEIGEAGDVYEQEADRIAEQVLTAPAKGHLRPRVQRARMAQRATPIQRSADSGLERTSAHSVERVVRTSGEPLEGGLRHDMEQRFGADFAHVRVHTDAPAAESAGEVNAEAYTLGSDIVFASGRFQPETQDGKRLLAHELTHVLQQTGPDQVMALQREPTRKQDRDLKQEQRRDDRRDRGRREGDPLGGFDSDWAGRVLLEHYLLGGGERLEYRDDADWTGYMTRSDRLRKQNLDKVIAIVFDVMRQQKLGRIGVFERYHAEMENGEGVVGYQFLHGTNADVGDFEIWGSGNVTKVNQAGVAVVPSENPYAPDVAMQGAGTRIDLDLRFQWNDKIDPNGKYISDDIKSAIAEMITFGHAESYVFSVTWSGTCSVFVTPGQGAKVMGGYPKMWGV